MLSVLIVAAAAAPSYYPSHHHAIQHHEHVILAEPEYAHIGSIVKHVPIATSHQSRTDYHSTPIVKTVLAPVEYVQPIVHHAPAVVHHHVEPAVVYTSHHGAHHHSEPLLSYAASPVHHSLW